MDLQPVGGGKGGKLPQQPGPLQVGATNKPPQEVAGQLVKVIAGMTAYFVFCERECEEAVNGKDSTLNQPVS
jgi:hypothetical protein